MNLCEDVRSVDITQCQHHASPGPERPIVPVNVCRGTLQLLVNDELKGVTNGSLANIIRQLSTLSRHIGGDAERCSETSSRRRKGFLGLS